MPEQTNHSSHNEAFIDGQNLHMNTKANGWRVDPTKFRIYLAQKYHVKKAYYFLGCENKANRKLYSVLNNAGFILVFREHSSTAISHKKGNVDTDIVFYIMHKLYRREPIDKIVLVSGDGDYYRLVKFLCDENKLGKIIFPAHKNVSTLYLNIARAYHVYLDEPDVQKKIALSSAQQKWGE